MRTFVCTQCGNCCRNLNTAYPDGLSYPRFLKDGPLLLLSEPTLYIQDWERHVFPSSVVVPCQVMYDVLSKTLLVLSYTLRVNSCPLVSADNLCTIYQDRPVRCRAFPSPFVAAHENELSLQGYQEHCTGELPFEHLVKDLGFLPLKDASADRIRNNLFQRYGRSYTYHLAQKQVASFIRQELLALENEGGMRFARKNNLDFSSIRNAPLLDVSALCYERTGRKLSDFFSEESLLMLERSLSSER